MNPQPTLKINWFIELDKYGGMNRQIKVQRCICSEFQIPNSKFQMANGKSQHNIRFLLYIITGIIDDIDMTKELGVSPNLSPNRIKKSIKFGEISQN